MGKSDLEESVWNLFPMTEATDLRRGQMCNLVIDFSPMRTQLIAHDVLSLLISLLASAQQRHCDVGDVLGESSGGSREMMSERGGCDVDAGGGETGLWNELKLNAIWGLRNLSYKADAELTKCFVRELGAARMLDMLDPACVEAGGGSDGADMLEHALVILRNLCHWASDGARMVMLSMDRVESGQGFRKLLQSLAACVADAVPAQIAVEAIGAMSNMAANCPEARLEIGMDESLLGQLHRGLTNGLCGARVMSEIGWLLANVSPPVKSSAAGPAGEPGRSKSNAEHESKEGSDSGAGAGSGSTHGEGSVVATAGSRSQGSSVKSKQGGVEDSAMAVDDKQDGGSAVGIKEKILTSGHGGMDADSEILARMNRVSMGSGIRKLLGLRHLDSDLRRKLRQLLRALAGHSGDEQDDDEGADDTEEEGVGEEEEEEEEEEGDWVIMTSHLQALEDNQGMEVDAEEVEEADHDVPMSGDWQEVVRGGGRVESEGAPAGVDGEEAPDYPRRTQSQVMRLGIPARTVSSANALGEQAVGLNGGEDAGSADERDGMAQILRELERPRRIRLNLPAIAARRVASESVLVVEGRGGRRSSPALVVTSVGSGASESREGGAEDLVNMESTLRE
jgi:hypothetical protein